MKRMIVKMFFCSLLLSCTNINRDKMVDKSELTYGDYRLFQNTPAWDLAKAVQDENEGEINKILSKDKANQLSRTKIWKYFVDINNH